MRRRQADQAYFQSAYQEKAFDQAHLAIEISLDAGHGGMVN